MPGLFRFEACATCCTTPCTLCLDNLTPDQFEVVIAGVTDGTCSECSALNDTYILERNWAAGAPCRWRYEFPDDSICKPYGSSIGRFEFVQLRILESSPGNYQWEGALLGHSLAEYHYWVTSPAAHYCDCPAVSGLSLSYSYSSVTPNCDASSATFTITAL